MNPIVLTPQEEKWILEQRLTRLTDQQACLIYPMGAERHLSSVLLEGYPLTTYHLRADIVGKNLLVIPGYGNSAFLFAQAGAKSVTVYDKDPITVAWMKAYKKYYHYRQQANETKAYPSVGELLTALTCWYPPLLKLPFGKFKHKLYLVIAPKLLRRAYFFYMLSLIQAAIRTNVGTSFEFNHHIEFHAEELPNPDKKSVRFDTAFVPYLLGVRNGIEREQDIVKFIKQMTKLVPNGPILVTPSQHKKEFHMLGKRYFETTSYATLESIPTLQVYHYCSDEKWYETQGLVVFRSQKVQ